MFEDEFGIPIEPWKDSACLGYVVFALDLLGYEPEKIAQVVIELEELFDLMTVEDANEAYIESGFYE